MTTTLTKPRQTQSAHMPGGASKRERYDWKLVDKPGEFASIDKNQLQVDMQYQRTHKKEKILAMAGAWSWVACGAISVALRDDGEWFVMDGQHRVLAAMLRDDITALPCMIFELETVADEARGFLATNTHRKAMTTVDRFKALLMTEDHAARVANELVLAAGRHVASGGAANAFSAVHILLQCIKEDEAALRRVWPTLVAVCAPSHRITQPLLMGLWYLERHLMSGESLSNTRWKNRLVQVGYETLTTSINQSAAFYGTGRGFKVCAIGVVKAINKGLRNTLPHTIQADNE